MDAASSGRGTASKREPHDFVNGAVRVDFFALATPLKNMAELRPCVARFTVCQEVGEEIYKKSYNKKRVIKKLTDTLRSIPE
ncbi:hypothetical protein [Pararhodobacter marinus]|uniref:hypothetical protein n=1 Tax=Pararhodobacter marinus TaxID=2184063 RepID=UPI0011B22676|nr:hypothetical protein [Pararhodobacter marinus]